MVSVVAAAASEAAFNVTVSPQGVVVADVVEAEATPKGVLVVLSNSRSPAGTVYVAVLTKAMDVLAVVTAVDGCNTVVTLPSANHAPVTGTSAAPALDATAIGSAAASNKAPAETAFTKCRVIRCGLFIFHSLHS
jgi:hypothetical protein